MARRLALAGSGLSFFASGFVVALGFVAAAVKFTAGRPGVLELLDVGRVQFAALHTAEWALVPASCLLVWRGAPRLWPLPAATLAVFLAKSLVVQPPLHARMAARLAGEVVPPSRLHDAYTALAVAMVVLLLSQAALGVCYAPAGPSEGGKGTPP